MSRAIVLDTETTGFVEPEAIEIAWIELTPVMANTSTLHGGFDMYCERFKPSKPIGVGALATHHIMDEELVDCPPSSSFIFPTDVEFLIGHNVDFDWNVLGCPDVKRICTVALSRDLVPEIDSHSLGAMLYHFDRHHAKERLKQAHSAAADVLVCVDVLGHLCRILGARNWYEVWAASEAARVPKKITFGKHKGELIGDIPKSYVQWLLKQSDVDPYLRIALERR